MAIAIDRELAKDLNNPTAELLNYCINKHQDELKRLQLLSNYYDGEHDILKRSVENKNRPNNKIVVNHAKYTVDMTVGFMVTNPIAYTSDNQNNNIDSIIDIYDKTDIVSHDTELEKDLSTFGIGYELIYLKKNKYDSSKADVCIKCIDPRGIFLVTDDTIDKDPLFAVHYQPRYTLQGGISYYLVKYYTDKWVITYRVESLGFSDFKRMDIKPHFFKEVPVIEYRNNEEKQGDFEQALSLIDAYNLLQSERLNNKEAFIDAILFMKGFTLQDGDGERLQKEKMLAVQSKEAAAEYLTKELDESGVSILRDAILDDIHKVNYVPNLNDKNFAGNISGEAMKYKLFGLLQLISVKSRYMVKGLRQRLQIVANIVETKNGPAIDVTGVKIKLKPNLPINTSDIIDQIVKAQDILSLETLLTWLPDIDDPNEEIKKLIEQKKQEIKMNREAMGQSSSYDDLEDEPDEEDNDDNSDIQKEK